MNTSLLGLLAPGTVLPNAFSLPLLSIILFLPGVVALAISLAITDARQARIAAIAACAIDLALAIVMMANFKFGNNGWVFQFADKHDWVSTLGITYWLGVDGISVFLVLLTTLIMTVAIVASAFMIVERQRTFLIFMLFLESAVLGVFMALNLFLFFVFWEAMLIPCAFLMGIWGEECRIYATMKFLVYTIAGSFLMLVGIFFLYVQQGTLDMAGPNGLIAHPVSSTFQTPLFFAFAIAFAIKLPIWPLHTWAPAAYSESPTPFLLVLAGILSKAGAFGFLRYALPLFPSAARNYAGLLSILCIIGMLYAAGLALVQTDIKKVVAYSSVSHMNLLALGLFTYNTTALDGSVLQMINHSVIITGLFLFVAYIAARTGTRMLSDMGGLGTKRPVLMWILFVFVLAGLDLPGLGSFSGEFLILVGVFRQHAWFASIAALTIIMAAWYMIRFFQSTMNGPVIASPQQAAESVEDEQRTAYQFPVLRRLLPGDLLPRELGLLVPLLVLIVYIGVQPDSLVTRMNPTTNPLSTLINQPSSHQGTVGGGR